MSKRTPFFPRLFPRLTGAAGLCAVLVLLAAGPAAAQTCRTSCNGCEMSFADTTNSQTSIEHGINRDHFGTHSPLTPGTGELGEHQRFLIRYLFRGDENIGGILPAWMLMSQQLTAVAMQQMWMIAEMLDAKHQLESQQLFRELAAETHKRYQPSMGMCILGTNVRSLAAAERHARVAASVLGQRIIDRQLGSDNVNAGEGPLQDKAGRFQQFVTLYCDRNDNNRIDGQANSGLGFLCAGEPPQTVNSDIDFTRTIELPRTLQVDLRPDRTGDAGGARAEATNDERDIFELSSSLIGHDVFSRIEQPETMLIANISRVQDPRAVTAKRSVIQNSFNAIVGMKAQGSPGPAEQQDGVGSAQDTSTYMRHLIRELGVTNDDELIHMLGDHGTTQTGANAIYRPSYYAQMEVLSKRLYQNPTFFVDLYDTPANVKRKSAALQAISLMLDRDIYDSWLRSEMLMSMLLELRLIEARKVTETDINLMNQTETGSGSAAP